MDLGHKSNKEWQRYFSQINLLDFSGKFWFSTINNIEQNSEYLWAVKSQKSFPLFMNKVNFQDGFLYIWK